jgi:hypothetical protein
MGKRPFQLPPVAQQIVEGLKDAIDCRLIVVSDQHDESQSSWTFGDWLSRDPGAESRPDEQLPVCYLEEAINDRWTLGVWSYIKGAPDPGVTSLVKWAARMLALHLPRRPTRMDPIIAYQAPSTGGGGPSGAAEVGIPVWWARRIRA